jgi:RNA polymerase sigma-70 factor (ECF subfamily)
MDVKGEFGIAKINADPGDHELVEQVKNGMRSAFSLLVRRHQKGLLRLCYRFVKDLDTAEDVVQETFIKVFERLHTFEARASFKSWLYQIAINTAKNKIRSHRSDVSNIDDVHLSVAASAESGLIQNAVSMMLQKYVEKLPHKQKTALVLRIYEDLSFKEIAEIMECPYDTAKANYRHALLSLKEEIQNNSELKGWSQEFGGLFTEMTRKAVEAE